MSTPSASTVPSTTGPRAVAPGAVAEGPASWRGVLVFLALAYGLAWAAQVALALAVRDNPEGLLVVAAALMWPPALGAVVARRWVEHGPGPNLGWLRLASDSVWPATVGHAALNAVAGLPLVLLQGVDPAIGGTRLA